MVGDAAPPLGNQAVVVGAVTEGPIDLRRDVVDALCLEPGQRVAEDAVILPVAARGTRIHAMLAGHRRTRRCHAGGRDAVAHLRPRFLNHVIHGLHHAVHVVAAPVAKRQRGARGLPLAVVLSTFVGGDAAGIEVVVIQDAVHVIVGDDFLADGDDAVDRTLLARVQNDGRAMGQQPAVLLQFNVVGRVPVGARAPAVRVHPGVTLHAALVAALHNILQRVKARILAAAACQITRPRLDARLVHRVTHRAHLKIDRVEVVDLQRVEQTVHLLHLLGGAGALRRPVQTPHRGNPRRAELTLGHAITPHLGHHYNH